MYKIDFDNLRIADSDFDVEKYYDSNGIEYSNDIYSAVLEYDKGGQEETDRFQYEIMKRAELDYPLKCVGIEINNFKDFQKLRNDEGIQLSVSLSCIIINDDKLVSTFRVQAYHGEEASPSYNVYLSDNERKQFNKFYDEVLSKDRANLKAEYDNDLDKDL